ncbi:MAG: tetratricopeptide repeat protein, partial [Desulfobacterales bacterium]|nr:tetratricopeptide repeat protein [Desulfobacterales bacterium]
NTVVKELSAVVKIPSRKDDAQLHGYLGQKLKKTGQVQEAAAEYRTASQLAPDNLYFLKQEGFCYYRLKDYSKALECLEEAFRKDPADFIVKGTLEKIYTTLGRLDDFLPLLEDTLQLHPHNVKLMGKIKKIRKALDAEKQ